LDLCGRKHQVSALDEILSWATCLIMK
jgi:hypothetical protein